VAVSALANEDIYAGLDPRELPIYGLTEAARYLGLSPTTLRSWVAGRPYPRSGGKGFFEPLINRPDPSDPRLSFTNLVEAHVLRALRVKHEVPMSEIRNALEYAQEKFRIQRLLIREELRAAAGNVFLDHFGKLVNLGKSGQLAMKHILEAYLKRLDRDPEGLPTRLYPVTPEQTLDGPKTIVIDPRVSFGKPILVESGVSTAAIADRIDAGESVQDVAEDYGITQAEVEEAILYERAA
jgi:uncharacterized protein (DUF433 family)